MSDEAFETLEEVKDYNTNEVEANVFSIDCEPYLQHFGCIAVKCTFSDSGKKSYIFEDNCIAKAVASRMSGSDPNAA